MLSGRSSDYIRSDGTLLNMRAEKNDGDREEAKKKKKEMKKKGKGKIVTKKSMDDKSS